MKRTIFLTIVGISIFISLQRVNYADPLIPVIAGGASVTYSFTSSSNSAVNVLATYTLSADGRSLRVDVLNNSQGLGIGEIIVQIRESWMPSASYIAGRPFGWVTADDLNGICCYFFDLQYRIPLDPIPASLLLPGQVVSLSLRFGPGAGVVQSLLPLARMSLTIPGTLPAYQKVATDTISNAPIPEPATLMLVAAGLGWAAMWRRAKYKVTARH